MRSEFFVWFFGVFVVCWCWWWMRASGFSFYRWEEPSGFRKRWTPGVFNYPPLLLSGQLDDNAGFNNCPGYSRTYCWNYFLFLLPCPLPSRDILWIYSRIYSVYSLPRSDTSNHKRDGNSEFKFKITSYYSRHYSNSAVTIQIRGTIQNIRYY